MGDPNVFPDDDAPVETEAADDSPLGSLRERRQRVRSSLYKDLPVPRYDPQIVVRFAPVASKEIEACNRRYTGDKDALALANAAILAKSCLRIMEYNDAGELVSLDPDDRDGNLQFGPRLAEILEEPMLKKAVDVVRALFATDGDIVSTADEVAVFSGYTVKRTEAEFEGN